MGLISSGDPSADHPAKNGLKSGLYLSTFTSSTQESFPTNLPQDEQPIKVKVGDVELHYIEIGKGQPLILLHGGQGDLRSWPKQMEVFAAKYRVISYSRRYHYPNVNPLTSNNHSALTDAADLAGFIKALKLGPVHLVGTSYGAFTALAFAMDHPGLVRSMVLAEPPVLQWATTTPRGAGLYREFMMTIHLPAGKAFASGDDEAAMRIFIDRFDGPGTFDSLPGARRRAIMQNAPFFKAVASSSDPFPNLPRSKAKRLTMPVLLVRGAATRDLDELVLEELGRTIPHAQKVTIPNAGHNSPRQNPGAFNGAVLTFLANNQL
jgi:pimeloyl-ACP methyl ester carboxylesterase